MKNFLQVNRALVAEKNIYLNLNQLPSKNDGGQSCNGNRQSRVMSQSGCSAVDVPMTSYGAPDEHPMSIRSASDGTRWNSRGWKYVAMIFAVLVLSVANVGMAWAWATNVYLNGDFTGGNWNDYTSTYQFKLKYSGTDGKFYLPVYASGSAQYFRLWTNNHCGPATNNTEIDAGGDGNAASSYEEHNWKYIGKAGIINVCVDQTGGKDWNPWVWVERPTVYIRHKWNNSSESTVAMTDNNDGTYTYTGKFSNSAKTTLAGPTSSGTSNGSAIFKKWSSPIVVGSPTNGDKCIFEFNASGYKGFGGATSNTGTMTITRLYSITYNGNGKTGGNVPSGATDVKWDVATTVAGNTGSLERTGYVFVGWNTAADGTGIYYAPGSSLKPTAASITLYAMWLQVHSPAGIGNTYYGQDLTVSGGKYYEVYRYAQSSNTAYVNAGTSAAPTTSGTRVVYNFNGTSTSKDSVYYCTTWMAHSKVYGYSSNTATASGEFPAHSVSQPNIRQGQGYILVVTGYDQFSAYVKDADTSNDKRIHIYINGVDQTNSYNKSWDVRRYDLDPEIVSIIRVVAHTDNNSSEQGFSLRLPSSSCTAPTGLSAGSTSAKGTTFTVTDGANTNNYEFYVSKSSTAPTAETEATYTSTSKTKAVTDLVAGTKYYAWVRSKCSASNKSDWVSGGNFTTSKVTMTPTLTNVTHTSGATSSIGGSDYTAVFTANTGYSMPNPTVTIGGNAATSGTHYTWSVEGSVGTITIPANKINGNIVITLNSVPSAPSSAVISGTYHYFPGDNISLTCTPSGNNGPTTYQWYKGGKENGNAIAGATSPTYTKNSCAFEDAGSYYCKVTCNATSIWAVTNSHENYDVKILRLYVNGSKGGEYYGYVDFVKENATTATASISLGSNWTYGFNIADGCGHYYGNNGTMQYNSCTNWTTNVPNTDCGLTTTNAATYTFTINYSNLGAIVTSVTYPIVNQASGKVIYFDNNVLKWTGSSIYYRIGHSSHSQADQLSLVPGTANLYKMTTREYNGFFAWQIGNAQGGNGSYKSIYNTKNSPAITASIAYEGGAVTAAAVTVTPGADHSKGGDAQNNNCEFYSKTITNGMKTDAVTISDYSNGTITVNYVNTSNEAASFTSGTQNLAHTVKLTSITTSPNEGYDAGAITINGGAYSANYVVTGATTIAASFTPQTYSITYKDQGGADFSGSHAAGHPTTHTYGTATTLKTASKTGYTFGGWYGNSGCTGAPMTSILGNSYTGNFTLYAKWTPNQYSVSHSLSNVTKTSGATGANAATYGTNYTAEFAASSGYALPETITVTIGGSTKTAGTEYTWDQGTGTVTIGGSYITGDIVITVSAAGGCPTGGDIFTLNMTYSGSSAVKVAANSTLAMTATHGTATGGTVTFGNQNGSSNDKMQIKKPGIAYINGDDAYIRIDFSCPIKTGDVLTFTSDENKEISFTTTDTRSTSVKTSSKKWTVTKAFNDATTLYIWRGSSNSVNLHTINIVRPVTVTFDKNGGSSVSPSSATYDGTSSCVLAETSRTDYHLDGWNTRADGSGDDLGLPGEAYHLDDVTTSTTTVYAIWSAKSCASGTLYKFQVNTGLTNGGLPHQQEVYVKTSDFLSIMTGGYLKAYNSSSSSDYIAITDKSRICIGNSSSYLLVQLDCPLRAGDKIKSTVTTQTLYVTKADVSRTSTVTLPIAADNEQTIPKALVGATELKIWSGSSNGGKISYFEIIRSASTYNVTYDGNDQTSTAGTVPTDATNYAYNATVTTAAQGSLAKTNYTFGGWNTANDGTGTNTAAGSTFSITDNTTLYAKWTQAVTLDANTANHGSTDGSATAVWNATGLTGITHATPVSGYKLTGYYTAATEGTKVLNSDGSFASSNVTDYITSGKWSRTGGAPTLYAQYEASGSLKWNLGVKTTAESLTTSSKESSFTEISTSNMSNATVYGVTYTASSKNNLTGQISTPAAYDANKYVYVTFQVASGYKFTPSSISVKVQPVGENEHKAVKLSLADATNTLVSGSPTKCDGTSSGKTTTVTLAGNGTYFTGTVTLKIYVYADETATAATNNCYRLGTPIEIQGAVEATCVMPSFTGLNYEETSYTVDETASAISVTGASNVSYLWKQNSTNDRSGITPASGTNDEASYTPPTGAPGTMYYWCELTNTCGTVKTPSVGITVSATKSDATISWTGTSASANYGGGGYTVKATVEQTGWNGNAADLTLSAPAGIRIYNIESGETASKKWVQASFDVTTAFDRETYSSTIPFVVTADATATYNAISDEEDVTFDACTGGGGEGSAFVEVTSAVTTAKTGMSNYWEAVGVGRLNKAYNQAMGSSADAQTIEGHSFSYRTGANNSNWMVNPYIAGVTKIRLYFYASAAIASGKLGISKVLYDTEYFSSQGSRSVVYDNVATNADSYAAADKGWIEFTLPEMAANSYCYFSTNTGNLYVYGVELFSGSVGSGGSQKTNLTWSQDVDESDAKKVTKKTTDAYFTITANRADAVTRESLGAITYSSSVPSVATVDPSTGKVSMVAAGTTIIKATLAASGCFKKKEITYKLVVEEDECSIAAGTLTLTSGSESKCSSDYVTLTLTGFESGATLQWKDGDTDINNGGNYTITKNGTTSTLTTNQPGTYSVIVTKGCFVRSNRITIKNASAEASVSKIIDEWYIKQGRLTPDIALFNAEGATSFTIKDASTDAEVTSIAGCTFELQDDVIYLHGYSTAGVGPTGIESAANETIKVVVTDACGNEASAGNIIIHKQIRTDKHVLAFVVNGTAKGGFTEGITADQTTNVGLYNAIAAQFDVQATNIYATDDEKKLKEYYSQYDILCITDYPNTKTKGVNSKSYVDAIGALIDIRPILTMEAFVSSLANWRAKGISGNPKSPTTRQYTMDLQCKDHEIFAGTDLTKVGEGDEAMYRVSMVDNTKEEYVSLDATYGGGAHAEKDGYNYGGKPALQGFTFTEEMANDLLPIGLINDGADNPLQVGIERQRNMEARLMVLGINSYAMERLTNDGERVVINALNYLMKKNQEDIADCSNTFVGGDDDEAVSTRYNWDVASHWSGNAVPDRTQKVRIVAPCVIPANVKPHVTGVIIAPNGKYNHGANTASGSLTIAAGGALIVDGKVEAATAPLYTETRATTPTDLILKTNSTAQSALIFDNDKGETQATVQMYSPSYWEIMEGTNKKKSYWSYVAIPIQDAYVGEFFYGAVTYLYDETSGWIRKKIGSHFYAFDGIGLSLPEGHTETFYGSLAPTGEKDVTLTVSACGGENLIGNSWTAPIQIANFETTDFGTATPTVMIYSTGRDGTQDDVRENAVYVTATAENDGTVSAGQWLTIPIGVPSLDGYDGLKVIPAMQAFQVNATSETTLHLDYDKLVRDVNVVSDNLTEKQHAPVRRSMAAKSSLMSTMRVRVSGMRTRTDVWLLEDDRFSDEFDNGWEAKYVECDNRSAQLYAQSEIGNMSFLAKPDIEGTVLGFAPSKDGNQYLFTFHYVGDEEYYLNDLKLTSSTLISNESSYLFTYEAGDTNRFYISRQPLGAPAITTGVDEVREEAKPRKFIYNDKMYILFNGRVFDATGKAVK